MASKATIPQTWINWMKSEEERTGLPAGTLSSLIKQETGFQQRFLDDPAAMHYSVGPNGEKPKSSARGLGGILEGTAKNPGYGVKPLQDWSVPEQLRFMADYVTARGKRAGSLKAGLAGYGEGTEYATQVMSRLGYTPSTPAQETPAPIKEQDAPVFAQLPSTPVRDTAPVAVEDLQPLVYEPALAMGDAPMEGLNLFKYVPNGFNFAPLKTNNPSVMISAFQPMLNSFSKWGKFNAA